MTRGHRLDRVLSFRAKREIFPLSFGFSRVTTRSLTFVRDDRFGYHHDRTTLLHLQGEILPLSLPISSQDLSQLLHGILH